MDLIVSSVRRLIVMLNINQEMFTLTGVVVTQV